MSYVVPLHGSNVDACQRGCLYLVVSVLNRGVGNKFNFDVELVTGTNEP